MMKRTALCALALVASTALAQDLLAEGPPSTESSTEAGPAGCVVRVDERLLLVKDVWSRRWSLPGGAPRAGETARQTAEREMLEETGVRVVAGRALAAAVLGFTAFECAPQSPLPMLNGATLALPNDTRREISEARLMAPDGVRLKQLRFPSQQEALRAWFQSVPPVSAAALQPSTPPRPALFDAELAANRGLQRLASPPLDALLNAASGLGTLNLALAVCLAIWAFLGWRAGVEAALTVCLASVLGATLKEIAQLARPCYLDAALCREAVSSFGCPSGHSVVAASWSGSLFLQLKSRARWALAAAPIACGVSRLYWGSHFAHDVLSAWALVAVLLAARHWVVRRLHRAWLPWQAWVGVFVAAALASLLTVPQPIAVLLLAFVLGLGLGLWAAGGWAMKAAAPAARTSLVRRLAQALWLVAAAFGVTTLSRLLAPQEATVAASVAHLLGAHATLGLMLPVAWAAWTWGARRVTASQARP